MRIFKRGWILRADPKDENLFPGCDLEHFVQQKFLKEAWIKDGMPLNLLVHPTFGNKEGRVRVKWVFPVIVIGAFRNKHSKI